ncbi:hypothetical protein GCM10010218_23880 [Streptomyces mashuensis]|uniref:Uncharacterized protein n=1 Tax=Streptomyces mashuensis TaxID=33904 RepID=A0A919B2U2_9ACTN|nr:hypothetical protein [Streptomyces mashuensis]GHF42014.1 hypothetical protein GCM10010218_23880 [Streptomyces mashuensis]
MSAAAQPGGPGRPGGPAGPGATRVRDVVRDVVTHVAPEELPLVTALMEFDDETVVRRLTRGGPRREPLGFGLGEVATMVTPVIWLVVDEAGRQLAGAAVQSTAKGTRAVLRKVLRKNNGHPADPVTLPPLTREQLAEIHRRVVESAVQRGVGRGRATSVADTVVARLALAGPNGGGDPGTPGTTPPEQG